MKEEKEITPDWVKQNLCMEDGADITECYSDESIEWISWSLRCFEGLDYETQEEVLEKYHIKYKK